MAGFDNSYQENGGYSETQRVRDEQAVSQAFSDFWNGIKDTYHSVEDGIRQVKDAAITEAKNTYDRTMTAAADKYVEVEGMVGDKIDQAKNLYDKTMTAAADKYVEAESWVGEKVDNAKNAYDNTMTAMADEYVKMESAAQDKYSTSKTYIESKMADAKHTVDFIGAEINHYAVEPAKEVGKQAYNTVRNGIDELQAGAFDIAAQQYGVTKDLLNQGADAIRSKAAENREAAEYNSQSPSALDKLESKVYGAVATAQEWKAGATEKIADGYNKLQEVAQKGADANRQNIENRNAQMTADQARQIFGSEYSVPNGDSQILVQDQRQDAPAPAMTMAPAGM